jgi:CheY-like chemotaxis protein/nitrogen-specific signal transduction histidine kinase
VAKRELEEKADQLALTSRYKSEFLANMSHELRTPLNSLLILSKQLAENKGANLSSKQVQYAQTIHESGADLMALINELLDLAKIESGTMELNVSELLFERIKDDVERSFSHVAEEKGLEFATELDENLPKVIETDGMRLHQVLRNLLSNAFKFTEKGRVSLKIRSADAPRWSARAMGKVVAFDVVDTGIGIPADKQRLIFEAFQQADGGTGRKYGGTGLGLSISRELARLLGGFIEVQSEVGLGSTFTLFLPERPMAAEPRALPAPDVQPIAPRAPSLPSPHLSHALPDDRNALSTGDRVLLVIEDDEKFALSMLELGREHGFRTLVALSGAEGLALALEHVPDAVTLDLRLPDVEGWVVLDRLKHEPSTRHIPVYVLSALDEEHRALSRGAMAFMSKPAQREDIMRGLSEIQAFVERRIKRMLLVEDDDAQRTAITDLIGNGDVEVVAVATAEGAIEKLHAERFDCMVTDLKLPGMSGTDLIARIKDDAAVRRLPIIVYTGTEVGRKEESELRRLAETVILKDIRSPERLLDETALFLHRVEASLPESKRHILRRLSQSDPGLAGRKVLIVDDDVRNIFALTSILEDHHMNVQFAETGQEALDKLEAPDTFDVVLMDIMMPEMDGNEAMRRVRARPGFTDLPIIALTAKAMREDRDKCIEAGASDYITKPVDPDQLVSLLRVWLYR